MVRVTPQRQAPITYPSPKYGPTPEYGTCEMNHDRDARAECSDCGGHFCLAHIEHRAHAGPAAQ